MPSSPLTHTIPVAVETNESLIEHARFTYFTHSKYAATLFQNTLQTCERITLTWPSLKNGLQCTCEAGALVNNHPRVIAVGADKHFSYSFVMREMLTIASDESASVCHGSQETNQGLFLKDTVTHWKIHDIYFWIWD